MQPYQLTPLAEQDLKEIYRYTIKTWGIKQAQHYARLLEKRFNDIASKTARVRNLSSLHPDVMVSRVSITIYFLCTQTTKRRKYSPYYMSE